MLEAPFQPGQTLIGPMFNEAVRVETVAPAGTGAWAVGVVGAQTERFRRVTLATADIASIRVLEEHRGLDGDGALLRLGVQAYSLGIAHEFDPYFGLSISRVDPLAPRVQGLWSLAPREPAPELSEWRADAADGP